MPLFTTIDGSGNLVWPEELEHWGDPIWIQDWVGDNCVEPVSAKEFAFILGLGGSSSRFPQHGNDEGERLGCMMLSESINRTFLKETANRMITEFSAVYIPAMVENLVTKFLDPPTTTSPESQQEWTFCNAYWRALRMVSENTYFYKYLRSNKPIASSYNRTLGGLIVARILDHATEWDAHFQTLTPQEQDSENEPHCCVLDCLVILFRFYSEDGSLDDILPLDLRYRLAPWLAR